MNIAPETLHDQGAVTELSELGPCAPVRQDSCPRQRQRGITYTRFNMHPYHTAHVFTHVHSFTRATRKLSVTECVCSHTKVQGHAYTLADQHTCMERETFAITLSHRLGIWIAHPYARSMPVSVTVSATVPASLTASVCVCVCVSVCICVSVSVSVLVCECVRACLHFQGVCVCVCVYVCTCVFVFVCVLRSRETRRALLWHTLFRKL